MKLNKKLLKKVALSLLLGLAAGYLTGCASIVSGHQQSVSVSTDPVKGADCTLENNKGKWYIPATPGSVTVHRSYEDLEVACKKKGFPKAHKHVKSSTKPIAFGNLIFGGIPGGTIDVATGAAYEYPQDIQMPIEKA